MKKAIQTIPVLIIISMFFMVNTVRGQHSLGINITAYKILANASNDFGTDFGVTYEQNLIHLKKGVFIYYKADMFYQPKSMEGDVHYATDTPKYSRYRYGVGLGTGLHFKGHFLTVEFGGGFSRHYVWLNRISAGMSLPGSLSSVPVTISRSYSLINSTIDFRHTLTESFFIHASAGLYTTLTPDDILLFRPAFGFAYKF